MEFIMKFIYAKIINKYCIRVTINGQKPYGGRFKLIIQNAEILKDKYQIEIPEIGSAYCLNEKDVQGVVEWLNAQLLMEKLANN